MLRLEFAGLVLQFGVHFSFVPVGHHLTLSLNLALQRVDLLFAVLLELQKSKFVLLPHDLLQLSVVRALPKFKFVSQSFRFAFEFESLPLGL